MTKRDELETGILRAFHQQAVGDRVVREFRVDELAATLLGISVGVVAESKTFRFPIDPWTIATTDGKTVLWVMSNIRLTYVRAPDPQTGTMVAYETLAFNGTPKGWRPNPPGNHL